ncbi:hypothetical protein PZB21_25835 [Rhizobium sp. CBK13]|uniref:hypothetical protein n=1 Tax=Rhizobium sp. CBK13 TaxID=3031399 RepID=UPI0023AF47AD|nr:hypothetical protein [Rhizobium sp. CBK13]MDE8762597.1 hypothetical protein [Rhizobium sp. CBK13]
MSCNRFKCTEKTCKAVFSVTTGTVFHARKLSFKKMLIAIWFSANSVKGLKSRVATELASGTLEKVLPEWPSKGPGLHAYYVSHRQVPSALRPFLDHLKGSMPELG